jgi:ribosomal protein S18 acetylase RimI-like enzyme
MESSVRIGTPPPEQIETALQLVFRDQSPEERAQHVALIRQQAGDTEGLWGATRDGQLLGAVFSQLIPGRVGTIWPPRVEPSADDGIAGALLRLACEQLRERGATLVQCLLREVLPADLELLSVAGFQHFADLFYLVSQAADFPQTLPSTELEFQPYSRSIHDRFAAAVEATYEATQDCPRMNGLRAIEDVLTGYRGAGEFDPTRWLLVSHHGRDIGCLILADYPEQSNYELVYMGVIPGARGHAWGKVITQYAQWRAGQAGRERLVLAADTMNGPGLRMYAEAGFRAWDRRTVLIRIFERPG